MTHFMMLQAEGVPEVGTFGILAGVIFFLVFAAVAYIAFRMMRKTVKWAIRITILLVVLLIAAAGSVAIYWKSNSQNKPVKPKSSPTQKR
jgi:glucan phosphoethanolaminetransferase (alkaline phosphatase superfamily)